MGPAKVVSKMAQMESKNDRSVNAPAARAVWLMISPISPLATIAAPSRSVGTQVDVRVGTATVTTAGAASVGVGDPSDEVGGSLLVDALAVAFTAVVSGCVSPGCTGIEACTGT